MTGDRGRGSDLELQETIRGCANSEHGRYRLVIVNVVDKMLYDRGRALAALEVNVEESGCTCGNCWRGRDC